MASLATGHPQSPRRGDPLTTWRPGLRSRSEEKPPENGTFLAPHIVTRARRAPPAPGRRQQADHMTARPSRASRLVFFWFCIIIIRVALVDLGDDRGQVDAFFSVEAGSAGVSGKPVETPPPF